MSSSFSSARRHVLRHASLLSGSLVLGCAFNPDEDHQGPNAPVADTAGPDARPGAPWALVLGSGGPRGFVHVGVLKALAELRLNPPMIVGASVGALVGALHACGKTALEIEDLALTLGPMAFGRLAVGGKERFSGAPIAQYVSDQAAGQPIEAFKTRFYPVAARASDRVAVAFARGDAGIAVQASCAIEGTFTPVTIRGVRYHDPDLISPVPVRLAQKLGARAILSVDCSAHEDRAPEGALRFRAGDLRKRELTLADVKWSDVNLHPYFGYWISTSEEFRKRSIEAGYQATLERAADILKLAGRPQA